MHICSRPFQNVSQVIERCIDDEPSMRMQPLDLAEHPGHLHASMSYVWYREDLYK
jgi:hypothetical protein